MNPVFTSPESDSLRTRSRAKALMLVDPADMVFQAQVASAPTSLYLQIGYDTVSFGAYTDIREGMTLIISTTTDHTDSLYEMRVAADATSAVIPVGQSEDVLALDYYVTVLNTYKPDQKPREGQLVDNRQPWHKLPPTIENLRSAYLIEASVGNSGQITLSPIGRAMASGATVDSDTGHEWEFPDGVVYDDGDPSTREITITVPHGHTWGRHKVTDSNNVSHWMAFEIYVQDWSHPTLAKPVDRVRINRTLNGHHCTATSYSRASRMDIMDGARCVIVSRLVFKGGVVETDPVFFVGYLSKDSSLTSSTRDKVVTFEISGLWESAGPLPMPQIAIRDDATTPAFDRMKRPTTPRAIWHVLREYSMIGHLASFSFFTEADLEDVDRWYTGDMNIPVWSLADAVEQIVSEIKAHLLGNPSGEMFLRRSGSFLDPDERDALDTILTLTNQDLRRLGVDRPHTQQLGRLIMGFRSFRTTSDLSRGGRASAPAQILGHSPETREVGNQLLPADLTDAEILAEARQRAGDLYAEANPRFTFPALLTRDGLAMLTPSVQQWLPISVTAADTVRGALATTVRTLLVGVEINYDTARGTWETTIEPVAETRGGAALIIASIIPSAEELDTIVLPLQSAYQGMSMDPSSNYPDMDSEPGPFDRGDMGGMGLPIPSDQSAEEGMLNPKLGCEAEAIAFDNPDNAPVTSAATVLDAPYQITARGKAQIGYSVGTGPLTLTYDFTTGGTAGFDFEFGIPAAGGVGLELDFFNGFNYIYRIKGTISLPDQIDINGLDVDLRATVMTGFAAATALNVATNEDAGLQTIIGGGLAQGTNTYHGADVDYTNIGYLQIEFGYARPSLLTETVRLELIEIDAIGIQPLFGDACFQWNEDAEGKPINIQPLGSDKGLFINNVVMPPPGEWNPNSEYTWDLTGTGSQVSARFEYDDYTNIDDSELFIETCRVVE